MFLRYGFLKENPSVSMAYCTVVRQYVFGNLNGLFIKPTIYKYSYFHDIIF